MNHSRSHKRIVTDDGSWSIDGAQVQNTAAALESFLRKSFAKGGR